MLKKLALALVLVITGVMIYAALQSKDMLIAREILIKASPEKIFHYINNSQKANEWMPWAEIDPKMVMTYSGPEEGVGSTSAWESPGQMGVGRAVVAESVLNTSVKTQLTYTKPMNMSQMAQITLTPTSDGTTVRWSVSGEKPFFCRLISTFMNMDKMVGGQFEMGLAKLKIQVEGLSLPISSPNP